MNDANSKKVGQPVRDLAAQVSAKAKRKLRAQHSTGHVWFGIGMMGLIGWSVATPTLLGAAIGVWLDRSHPGSFSWTLALMMAGLLLGCVNAWHWIGKEDKAMRDERGDPDA
jgi:ATP synthase protein I